MIEYNNGFFCRECGNLCEMQTNENWIKCYRCNKEISLFDINFKIHRQSKIISEEKDWLKSNY